MVHQISWIKASLDILSTKDEKSRNLQIKKYCVFLSRITGYIVVKFYSILVYMRPVFQFVRETGSKSKKRSMKKFRAGGGGGGGCGGGT